MHIVICEDDPIYREHVAHWVLAYFDNEDLTLTETEDIKSLLAALSETPDLSILDIHLPDGNVLDTMREYRDMHSATDIIYMTSLPQDVGAVANTRPFGFIDKTLSLEAAKANLHDLLSRWLKLAHLKNTLVYQADHNTYTLRHSSILYFEKHLRKITPHTTYGTFPPFYCSMKDLILRLDNPAFIPIGQSFLVHDHHVTAYYRDRVHLTNGICLPISQGYQKKVHAQVTSILRKEQTADE